MKCEKRIVIWAFFVFVLVFAVYVPALNNGFLMTWDDPTYITNNSDIAGLTPKNIKAAFTNSYIGNYAPLHIISYAIDYTLFGLNPIAFHAVNNLFHAINAVLVMLLIFRLSGSMGLSVFSALLFALHPVQVESVAWVTERKNVLSTTFALGSFLIYLNFLRAVRWSSYAGSLFLFAIALLVKSSVVVLPLLLCLYIFLYVKRNFSSFAYTMPFFILSAAASIVAVVTQEKFIVPYHGGSPYATALTMVTILVKYLKNFLFPVNLAPSYNPVIYSYPALPVIISIIILAGLIATLWIKRDERNALFWAGWAFIPLLPVLQIVPIVTLINDRYLYLSLIGLAPLVIKITGRAAGKWRWLVISLILILLLSLTFSRINLWKAGPALWVDAAERSPDNVIPYIHLSAIYHMIGKLDKAYMTYQKVFAMAPNNLPNNLELRQRYGALLLQMGRYREAVAELKMVYDTGKRDEELVSNLGYAYMHIGDLRSGMTYHREVVALNPSHANSIYGLAMGYEKLGDKKRAAEYWKMFLDITPPANPWRDKARKRLENIIGD